MTRLKRDRIGPPCGIWSGLTQFYVCYIESRLYDLCLPILIPVPGEVQQHAQGHTASKEQDLNPGCLTLEPTLANISLNHSNPC